MWILPRFNFHLEKLKLHSVFFLFYFMLDLVDFMASYMI